MLYIKLVSSQLDLTELNGKNIIFNIVTKAKFNSTMSNISIELVNILEI
jgi:hypothetical protein